MLVNAKLFLPQFEAFEANDLVMIFLILTFCVEIRISCYMGIETSCPMECPMDNGLKRRGQVVMLSYTFVLCSHFRHGNALF